LKYDVHFTGRKVRASGS